MQASTSPITAYIGLGSNLEDPVDQVRRALDELDQIPDTRLIKASSLYRSDPVGPPGQPDYINAVAEIETSLDPIPLLRELQAIEQAHERVRIVRWGPRTLDLDLLLYADQEINDPDLIVPHVMLPERGFVLYPLQEIAPSLEIPGRGSLASLIHQVAQDGLEKMTEQQ